MKKFKVIFLLLLIVLTLASCVDENKKKIYYDDSLIVAEGDSYSYVSRAMIRTDKSLTLKFSKFYGKETLYTYNITQASSLTLDLDITIASGLLKLCLIYPDDTIIIVTDSTYSGERSYELPMGKTRLVLVGNEAKGEININISLSNI